MKKYFNIFSDDGMSTIEFSDYATFENFFDELHSASDKNRYLEYFLKFRCDKIPNKRNGFDYICKQGVNHE